MADRQAAGSEPIHIDTRHVIYHVRTVVGVLVGRLVGAGEGPVLGARVGAVGRRVGLVVGRRVGINWQETYTSKPDTGMVKLLEKRDRRQGRNCVG